MQYASPISTVDDGRPVPYENKGFPYNEILDPRRYEELVYCLFKNELGKAAFDGFDQIYLLSGSADKGRDCVLVRDGKNYGLIQCKRYDRTLAVDDVGAEITKFVLNYLAEPELIHDVRDFSYFITSSKGFNNACVAFLTDFNKNITENVNLQKWIDKHLQSPTLKPLFQQDLRGKVLEVLTTLKVIMIHPNDMDLLLLEERNIPVVNLFFKVRTVTDNTGVLRLEQKLDRILRKTVEPTELKRQLKLGSTSISEEKNHFEGITGSHVARDETKEIVDWILDPLEKSPDESYANVCLLAANAGIGKTVVMRDVAEALTSNNVPVLAMKADKVFASNLKELQDKLGLGTDLNQLIEDCLAHFSQLVILIDQIDALSHSLAGKRAYFNTYTQLIAQYRNKPGVRIVMSVRIFDLYYDGGLRVFKQVKKIELKPLSKETVLELIGKLGISERKISISLLELLRIPNNLDVFSRIHRKGTDFSGINSIQDLYRGLYEAKITNANPTAIDRKRLAILLNRIVEEMYALQQITISQLAFEEFHEELKYLKSERIIKEEDYRIQFFHQTFFDYLYAKLFTSKGWSITRFIKEAEQSMMIRSGIKMILNFTRETNQRLYESHLKTILNRRNLHFHIKHLVVSMLASEKSPTEGERHIFSEIIYKDYDYFLVFAEHLLSKEWLALLIRNGRLDILVKEDPLGSQYAYDNIFDRVSRRNPKREKKLKLLIDVLGSMLKRNLVTCEPEIINFSERISDLHTVRWLLFSVKDWKNKRAIELYEKCFGEGSQDHHGNYMVLENIVKIDALYVFNRIKGQLTLLDTEEKKRLRNYADRKIFDAIMESIPEIFLDHLTAVVIKEGKSFPEYDDNGVVKIHNIKDLFSERHSSLDTMNIYRLLALGLRKEAEKGSAYFIGYLASFRDTRLESILKVIIYALVGQEKRYLNEVVDVFGHLHQAKALNSYDDLNKGCRKILSGALPFLDKLQLDAVERLLLTVECPRELARYQRKIGEEPWYPTSFGYTMYRYLRCIPVDIRNGRIALKIKYQEYFRKFGKPRTEERSGLRPASGPINAKGYQNMDFKGWLGSFYRYNAVEKTSAHAASAQYDHAEEYGRILKDDVKKHLTLIRESVYNEKVSLIYTIKGLWAMHESKLDVTEYVKHVMGRKPMYMDLYYLVHICGDLIKVDNVDAEIFTFLLEQARPTVTSATLDKADNLQGTKISIQELAVSSLLHVRDKRLANEVFTCLEEVMKESLPRVQKAALRGSAYLLALSTPKAVDFFVRHVARQIDPKAINSFTWSLSYLVNRGFDKFIPLFERVVEMEDRSVELLNNMTTVLLSAWYLDHEGAEELFWRYYEVSPDVKSQALSLAFEHFYRDGKRQKQSLAILFRSLEEGDKKVRQRFSVKFLHIDHIEFADLHRWLNAYVRSRSFRMGDYFLEYLLANVAEYPIECVDLFGLAIANKNAPRSEGMDEPNPYEMLTKFIVGAYNVLPSEEVLYKQKLLKLFDWTLKNVDYRRETREVLERML